MIVEGGLSVCVVSIILNYGTSCLTLLFSSKVQEELLQVIKDVEEGLLHLKRARLLREADSVLHASYHTVEDVKAEPLDPVHVEPEPLEDQCYSVGSKCRFCHVDGRWYNGQIIELVCSDTAKIAFLTPISENMLVSICFSVYFQKGCFCFLFLEYSMTQSIAFPNN